MRALTASPLCHRSAARVRCCHAQEDLRRDPNVGDPIQRTWRRGFRDLGRRTKLIAFMIGGFIAGAGGAMEATGVADQLDELLVHFSLLLVGYAYLGGITRFPAPSLQNPLSGGIVTAIFNFQATLSRSSV